MQKSFGRRAGALAIAIAAAAAVGAPAAQAAPLTSCGGGLLDDSGDGFRFTAPFVQETASDAPHYDITEVFATTAADTVKLHMKVADMKAEPDDVWWPTWALDFTAGGMPFEVNARMIDGAMTYYYWADGANQGVEISGEVVEGPGGGIIIDLPSSAIPGYEPGMALTELYAYTQDGQVAGATPHDYSDRAPNEDTSSAEIATCGTAAPAQEQKPVEQVAASATTASSEAPAAAAPAPAPEAAAPAAAAPAAKKAASKKAKCAKTKAKSKKRKAAACKAAKKSKKAKKRR